MKDCPCKNCICVPVCRNRVYIEEENTILVLDLVFDKIFKNCSLAREFCMTENRQYSRSYRIYELLDILFDHPKFSKR